MNTICIYHASCSDGFGAALVYWLYAQTIGNEVKFIPAQHGDKPPNVEGKSVVILDFSYPREQLIEMEAKSNGMLVLDHHKTAKEALEGLSFCEFDMERSGAVMAWNHFFPGQKVPILLQYVQDRDLWKKELPNTEEVSTALKSIPMEFTKWLKYLHNVDELADTGKILVQQKNRDIETILAEKISTAVIGDYNVPCINCRIHVSEVCGKLAEGEKFAATYYDTADKRVFSLRSDPNGLDVSEIAKMYGGGGHCHAAGFSIDKPPVRG